MLFRSFIVLAVLCGILLQVGCVAPPAKDVQTVPFDKAAVEFANRTGKSKISGQAFYTRNKAGANSVENTTYTCAGRQVQLIPLSAYTKAETDAWVKKIQWSDPRPIGTAPYNERTAVCDAQGNFEFSSLPAGKWIVFSLIPFRNGKGFTVAGGHVNLRQFAETDGVNSIRVILADASNN